MPPVPPQVSGTASIAFALGWGIQNVSVPLVVTSLQSLDNYLMSTLIATGSGCVSGGGQQVSITHLGCSNQERQVLKIEIKDHCK